MEQQSSSDILSLEKRFAATIAVVCALGVIMVYSASYIFAKETLGNSSVLLLRQLGFLAVGVLVAGIISQTKFNFWLKYSLPLNLLATTLLGLTLISSLGVEVKGASRWIRIAGFQFQPGELLKVTILLLSVHFFTNFNELTNKQKIQHTLALIAPLFLFVIQPDFGSFGICSLLVLYVCFLSPVPRKLFALLAFAGPLIATVLLVIEPYRVGRLMAFLDPWKNPRGSGFQIIQSYLAFANGSYFGQGLGNSNEKLFYLPEAHNDFIFSVIGEELGLVGVSFVVLLFLLIVYYGLKLSMAAYRSSVSILISGVTFAIGIQAFVNMAVVLGLLPTKGLNLPFVSYGGSSLIANAIGVGLIFSATREVKSELSAVGAEGPRDYLRSSRLP